MAQAKNQLLQGLRQEELKANACLGYKHSEFRANLGEAETGPPRQLLEPIRHFSKQLRGQQLSLKIKGKEREMLGLSLSGTELPSLSKV